MTDPTITIAGLEARIKCLVAALRTANTGRAEAATLDSAACGYNAQLRTERDALAAQLAEVRAELAAAPKVCAIHSYEHGPGPCMTCGAWPPGTRELIAACQTRIAGLEQAANERSRTGQMSEPERSEWIGAAVAVADALGGSLGPVSGTSGTIDPREWIHFAAGLADRAKKLTARVAELEARPVLTAQALCDALVHARAAGDFLHVPAAVAADVANRIVTGGPVTLPAQDVAARLTKAYSLEAAAVTGNRIDNTAAMERALASLGAPPTSPTAARPVFAGVSEDDLCVQMLMAADPSIDPGVALTMVNGVHRAKVRAVLTRLKTTLVAPVDPREFALVMIMRDLTDDNGDVSTTAVEAAARYALTARGIPVTPEVGK